MGQSAVEYKTERNGEIPAFYDVLIVGCGPVGATLANYLRLFGHNVAIFDRDKEVFYAPRAMGFDDESLRILQALGVLDRLHEEGHLYRADLWFYDSRGRLLATFDRRQLGDELLLGRCNQYDMTMFHQPGVEQVLRDDFQLEPKVNRYLGYEVLSVNDDGPRVTLKSKNLDTGEEQEFAAHYLVGCDGASSLVRRALGVERIDLDYSEEYLVVDTIVDDEHYFETRIPHGAFFVYDPKQAGVMAKGLHGHVRFDFLRHPDVVGESYESEADFDRAARNLIVARGHDPEKYRVIRKAPYTFYASMPSRWRQGRLLVAGDAAHLTPPWSGQGLNMGMRDAANVSFKLHLVLTGKASDHVLDTYDAERQPVSMETIKAAVEVGKTMQTHNSFQLAMRGIVYFLARHSRFVTRQLFKAWRRKPPYRDGLMGKTPKLSGAPMIQPWVEDLRGKRHLLDDLIGLRFALVATSSPTGESVYRFAKELDGALLKLEKDFIDPDGTITRWFDKNKINAVLIRPDRCIFDAGNDGNALCQALFNALNAPSSMNPWH